MKTMKYVMLLCAVCLVACGNNSSKKPQPVPPAVKYGYRIVAEYPHDNGAYTQGLLWHEGALYESTGEWGRSRLRRVELPTGEVTYEIDLESQYFGEGAALIGDRIFQLTWKAGRCFVWNADTFEPLGEFTYRGEGWGLTTDGTKLYMSDGTPNIAVRNPDTFEVERTIIVRDGEQPVNLLNELEWIEGKIWANIYDYRKQEIMIIDPADGRVEGVIDFTGILSRLTAGGYDVMNGIAWDAEGDRIFVTGKHWDKLFEIELVKK